MISRVALTLLSFFALVSAAFAQRCFVIYSDAGLGWRAPEYAQDVYAAQRDHIWQVYNAAVADAKSGYDIDVASGISPDIAQAHMEDREHTALDEETAALDQLYPRWEGFSTQYPDLFLVGFLGPCRYASFILVDGQIDQICFYQACASYPGLIFGWHYGEMHHFDEWRRGRDQFQDRLATFMNGHGPRMTDAQRLAHDANVRKLASVRNMHLATHEYLRDPAAFIQSHPNGWHPGSIVTANSGGHTKQGSGNSTYNPSHPNDGKGGKSNPTDVNSGPGSRKGGDTNKRDHSRSGKDNSSSGSGGKSKDSKSGDDKSKDDNKKGH